MTDSKDEGHNKEDREEMYNDNKENKKTDGKM